MAAAKAKGLIREAVEVPQDAVNRELASLLRHPSPVPAEKPNASAQGGSPS